MPAGRRALAAAFLMVMMPLVTRADAAEQGDFDFYVLALSWSPTYCKHEGVDASPHQCRSRTPHRFIVHGLWPQYEQGYPERCPDARQRIDRAIAVGMEDIMPSHGLVFHQWRKHGTCSGLEPSDYFALTRQAYGKVTIPKSFRSLSEGATATPAAIEKAFMAVNPGLDKNGIAVTCDRGAFEEVRICLTKDLGFQSCHEVDKANCRATSLTIPPPALR